MKPNCTSFFYLLEVTQYSRSLCLPHFKPLAFFFVQLNAHSLYQLCRCWFPLQNLITIFYAIFF